MKRIIFLLILVFTSRIAFAQLEVVPNSLKHVKGFVYTLLDRDKQYDENNKPTSLIKLKTINIGNEQRKRLKFAGDMQTAFMYDFKDEDGEVWIYLTSNPTYIKISHPDYSSCTYYFPISLEPHQCYELTLSNKFGFNMDAGLNINYLIIKSDHDDALIYIDNQYIAKKEAFKSFNVGEEHSWRIECKFYHTESGKAIITPEKSVVIDKKLRPAYGYLNITSEPENEATIFIDGNMIGKTPFKTDKLPSGNYMVKVIKDMYDPVEQIFTVTDGGTVEAVMKMTANFVNVTLTTDSESDIYVDNEYKGKGSWSGQLSKGKHSVEAKKALHHPVKQTINLVLGKDENIAIGSPIPIYCNFRVESFPMGATIYIDGNVMGMTPEIITNIIKGEHELRLEKEGYVLLTKKITIDEKSINTPLRLYLEAATEIRTEINKEKNIVSEEEKVEKILKPSPSSLPVKTIKSRKNKHLNWFIRLGANMLSGNLLPDEKYETLFDMESSKVKLPTKFGYNLSGGFMSSIKTKGAYWGIDIGLSSELKIKSYNYYKEGYKYDSDIIPAFELSPFIGWKLGKGKVKFDPHLGAFLGYGAGFGAGCNAGLGVWFGRFNIDIDYHQSFISRDMKYFYHNNVHSDYVSYSSYAIQIKLGFMFGKNK